MQPILLPSTTADQFIFEDALTPQFYLALYTHDGAATPASRFEKGNPLNHIGILVDDLDEIERRVVTAGLVPFSHADYEPGRRFYFFDPDGTEFEVVSYV